MKQTDLRQFALAKAIEIHTARQEQSADAKAITDTARVFYDFLEPKPELPQKGDIVRVDVRISLTQESSDIKPSSGEAF